MRPFVTTILACLPGLPARNAAGVDARGAFDRLAGSGTSLAVFWIEPHSAYKAGPWRRGMAICANLCANTHPIRGTSPFQPGHSWSNIGLLVKQP
jgi:hypothetical protein